MIFLGMTNNEWIFLLAVIGVAYWCWDHIEWEMDWWDDNTKRK